MSRTDRGGFVFIKKTNPTNKYDHTAVRMKTESTSLDDILETFGDFLRASGFSIKGRVEIVEEQPERVNPGHTVLISDDDELCLVCTRQECRGCSGAV